MPWNLVSIGAAVSFISFALSLFFLLIKANGDQPKQVHRSRFCFMILFLILGLERLAAIDMQDALHRLIDTVMRVRPDWLMQADSAKFGRWRMLRNAGNLWAIIMIPTFALYVLWEIDLWRGARIKTQLKKEKP